MHCNIYTCMHMNAHAYARTQICIRIRAYACISMHYPTA